LSADPPNCSQFWPSAVHLQKLASRRLKIQLAIRRNGNTFQFVFVHFPPLRLIRITSVIEWVERRPMPKFISGPAPANPNFLIFNIEILKQFQIIEECSFCSIIFPKTQINCQFCIIIFHLSSYFGDSFMNVFVPAKKLIKLGIIFIRVEGRKQSKNELIPQLFIQIIQNELFGCHLHSFICHFDMFLCGTILQIGICQFPLHSFDIILARLIINY
jgi:hypothetical protein